ncbi:MAG: hypothetical protein MJ009_08040, partial [Paludibacteraceae bacterium]|nr:hypothetical protein [Paludibacteraceae bacterium]
EKTAMTFYAVPQGGERTGLDGLKSVWTEGDQIKIFAVLEETLLDAGGDVFTLSKGAGTDYGEFTGESVEADGYIALYPASLVYYYNDYYGPVFNLSNTQTYAENSFATNTVPLFAYSESKNLQFENAAGLLRVGIKVTSPTTVTSMVIKDKNSSAKLWGTFGLWEAYMMKHISDDGDNTLTMDLGSGVELGTSDYTYFFFSLPDGALANGFTIEMEDLEGKTAIIDYSNTDKKVLVGKGKTLEVDDVEFVTPAPPTRPACQSALDADANWVPIGSQQWLKVNTKCIEYDTESEAFEASWLTDNTIPTSSSSVNTPYYTDPTIASKPACMSDEQFANLGMLYNWAAAVGLEDGESQESAFTEKRQGICPNGSHVPSVAEWNTLIDELGGRSVAGKHLKTTSGWYDGGGFYEHGLDTYGFAALPAGGAMGSTVFYVGSNAFFWSATPDESGSGNAYYKALYYDNGYLDDYSNLKSNAFSVRCIMD